MCAVKNFHITHVFNHFIVQFTSHVTWTVKPLECLSTLCTTMVGTSCYIFSTYIYFIFIQWCLLGTNWCISIVWCFTYWSEQQIFKSKLAFGVRDLIGENSSWISVRYSISDRTNSRFYKEGGGTVNGAFSFPKRGFQASSDVNDNSCGESVFEPPLSSGDLAKKKKNINFLSENGVTSFYNQWRLPVDVIRTTQSQCR